MFPLWVNRKYLLLIIFKVLQYLGLFLYSYSSFNFSSNCTHLFSSFLFHFSSNYVQIFPSKQPEQNYEHEISAKIPWNQPIYWSKLWKSLVLKKLHEINWFSTKQIRLWTVFTKYFSFFPFFLTPFKEFYRCLCTVLISRNIHDFMKWVWNYIWSLFFATHTAVEFTKFLYLHFLKKFPWKQLL